MLSHPRRIVALVSRYLTNKLIRSRPLLRWNHTFAPGTITSREIIEYYPQFPVAILDRRVRRLPVTTPFAALPPCGVRARLACLIHAANVHSEPESNPSICLLEPDPDIPKDERADFKSNGKSLTLDCLANFSNSEILEIAYDSPASRNRAADCSGLSNQIAKEQTDE